MLLDDQEVITNDGFGRRMSRVTESLDSKTKNMTKEFYHKRGIMHKRQNYIAK